MADIKRDFLYEFNRGLKETYSSNPAIVSVFENIEKGDILLSPVDIPEKIFVDKISKFIFMMKRIIADPYKSFKGVQEVVSASNAQNVDAESVKLTLADTSLWTEQNGKRVPKRAYTLVNDYVFTNYENAFVYQLIKLVLSRLMSIKSKLASTYGVDGANRDGEEIYSTLNSYIKSLNRIIRERVFSDNSGRVVDMSDIFITDILNSDQRYHYCYKFFVDNFRKPAHGSISADFRVLFHNYSLVKLMYYISKIGYKINEAEYYLSDSGKMFIDSVEFNGEKKLVLTRTKNGVDISSENKSVHIEFSKSMIRSINNVKSDYDNRAKAFESNKYINVYFAYLMSENINVDGILEFGYKDSSESVVRLINTL